MNETITTSIPDCQPPRYFDTNSLTSKLCIAPGTERKPQEKTLDCIRGVQTVPHPPLPLKPLYRAPSNRFRQEVLRRYPHLVPRDSLYEKEEKKLQDPDDTMISVYRADFVGSRERFELFRSGNVQAPAQESTIRLPGTPYKPRSWCPISVELKKFYSLPGGGWALKNNLRPKEPEPMHRATGTGSLKVKWESEYQANINGLANYMKRIGALTRKQAIVHRIPTLPVGD
ncbi:hypothetical protein GE061_019170 [Apolygus lucorum]|uniref:Uncharacterized protein n=1 Tax=Apolygus lucorum TaxID=248454 RepID=A0A8S9X7R5_APOLU|nr:hypothetical protein GE061_019170 [Apolygus lucorum]